MPFSYVQDHATNQAKDTVGGTSALTTVSPVSTIPVGNVAVLWIATDSEYDSGNPNAGPIFGTNACHDDAGNNIWASVACGQNASVKGGASVSIFVCYVQTAITTSDTITATSMRFPSGTEIARGISLLEFSLDPGYVWANATPVSATGGADPAAISISSLASGYEYLFLHGLGAEGPDTDAYTWDSDYTAITGDGTTGGADDTNIHVRGGWRISSSITSDTVDVTSDTADRDHAQVLTALAAVPYDDVFPTTPVLDDFNRADEDPLTQSGGWVSSGCSAVSGPGEYAQVVSNVASGRGGQYRTETFTGAGDHEVYATMSAAGWLQVVSSGSGCADAGNADGLGMFWGPIASNLDPIRHAIHCGRQGNQGEISGRRLIGWHDRGAGFKAGIQRRTDATHFWADVGGGWKWFGAGLNYDGWQSYTGGKIGFALGETTVRMDDFGGGASILTMPQIIRRL